MRLVPVSLFSVFQKSSKYFGEKYYAPKLNSTTFLLNENKCVFSLRQMLFYNMRRKKSFYFIFLRRSKCFAFFVRSLPFDTGHLDCGVAIWYVRGDQILLFIRSHFLNNLSFCYLKYCRAKLPRPVNAWIFRVAFWK